MGFRPHLADRLSATGLRPHPLIVSLRWETSSSPPDPLSAMRRGGTTCQPRLPPLPKGEGARGGGHERRGKQGGRTGRGGGPGGGDQRGGGRGGRGRGGG